jgi:hypothetical protein
MALETATYVSQLVATNPTHADGVNQGDAHLRLIKSVLQATFPNLTGALTAALAALNLVGTDGTSTAPSVGFTADATAGFYRPSTGHVGIVGRLIGNGSKDPGEICIFPRDPGTSICARGGSAAGTERYVLLDGSTYASTTFPDLAASGHVTVSGSNFTVDQLCDTGRFIRQYVSGTTSPGQTLANQNQAHTHTLSVSDPGHTHAVSDPGHSHGITDPGHAHELYLGGDAGGSASVSYYNGFESAYHSGVVQDSTTGITINNATTGITNATATTGISVTAAQSGGSEARPESYVAFICQKT